MRACAMSFLEARNPMAQRVLEWLHGELILCVWLSRNSHR
jgi:hypothetical protein